MPQNLLLPIYLCNLLTSLPIPRKPTWEQRYLSPVACIHRDGQSETESYLLHAQHAGSQVCSVWNSPFIHFWLRANNLFSFALSTIYCIQSIPYNVKSPRSTLRRRAGSSSWQRKYSYHDVHGSHAVMASRTRTRFLLVSYKITSSKICN